MTNPHPPAAPGDDDHEADGHGDGHAHGEEPLGPVDIAAWGAGAVGIAISLAIALCFVLATSGIG